MIAALWSRIAPYLLGAGVILGGLAVFGMRQKAAGRAEAKADIQTRTLEIKDAQQQAAARAPVDSDGVVDRLRNGSY